jgi:hypothetical protein
MRKRTRHNRIKKAVLQEEPNPIYLPDTFVSQRVRIAFIRAEHANDKRTAGAETRATVSETNLIKGASQPIKTPMQPQHEEHVQR